MTDCPRLFEYEIGRAGCETVVVKGMCLHLHEAGMVAVRCGTEVVAAETPSGRLFVKRESKVNVPRC